MVSESFGMSIRISGKGFSDLSSEQNPGCFGITGDHTVLLRSNKWILINHYKDLS